jgi:NTE family protein
MRKFCTLACAAVVALGLVGAHGARAQPSSESAALQRPRIGLVLGGGGAKGAAHVGVLRVLDELRVPVDCVVGTSMGALVGAVLAAGTHPAELERQMVAIKWEEVVGGQGRRDRTPIGRKLSGITYTNSFEFGIGRGRLLTPGGFISTEQIEQALRTLVARAEATRDFDDLPIPFRAIATDMQQGEMVVLDSGDLPVAMRASMAAPGVFAPVMIDGRLLSDGGLMRNVPIDVARDLCADVVIAVWLTTPPRDLSSMASAFSMLERSLDVSIDANVRAQIETLTPADVGVEVPMGDIGSADFQRVPDAIKLGRAAAEAQRASLLRYSVAEDEYIQWAQSVGRADVETYTLAAVNIAGAGRVNPEYISARLTNVAPGASVTPEEVAADVQRVYELGDFERVDYQLVGESEDRSLQIDLTEKSWGPHFLRADFGLATYEGGDIFAIVRVDHDRTWVNDRGGRWHNALQIGRESLLTTDFYQPLDVRQRFFVRPIASAHETLEQIYVDDDRVAEYRVRQVYGQVDVGANFGTVAQVRFGLRHGWEEGKLDTGFIFPDFPQTTNTSLRLQGTYDTRDSVALPTRGSFLNVRYVRSDDWLDGEFAYETLEGVYARSFTVRDGDSLSLIVGGADLRSGELSFAEDFELGGIRTFPGLRPGELRGNAYWFAGTAYYWRLFDMLPLFGNALYAGLRVQAGRMEQRIDAAPDDTLVGLSGSVGGRTPLGPFVVSVGYVDNGSWQLQFSIGRPVSEGSMLDELY